LVSGYYIGRIFWKFHFINSFHHLLHLIKLIDRTEAQTTPLEQVKDKISSYLEAQKQNQEVAAYLATLRSTAKIDYKEGTKKIRSKGTGEYRLKRGGVSRLFFVCCVYSCLMFDQVAVQVFSGQ